MDTEVGPQDTPHPRKKASLEERQEIVSLAKAGARNRRSRYMQVTNFSSCFCVSSLSVVCIVGKRCLDCFKFRTSFKLPLKFSFHEVLGLMHLCGTHQ